MTSAVSDVALLAEAGFFPVRLHYPIFENGGVRCSCGRPECGDSAGKHPVESGWGRLATAGGKPVPFAQGDWNVGIILGLCHGIPPEMAVVDIEDDSADGRKLADALLAGYPAPTYSSGKSLHRLYRWTSDLPDVANLTISGLECRLGGKGKETQSVAPPSKHRSGVWYYWLDGMSPSDLPLTPLPVAFREFLQEEFEKQCSSRTGGPGGAQTDTKPFRIPGSVITAPGRHHALLKYANSLWRRAVQLHGINGIEDEPVQDEVWMQLAGANLLVCQPPKTEAEILVIFTSSRRFMAGEVAREADASSLAADSPSSEATADEDVSRDLGVWLKHRGLRMHLDPKFDSEQVSPNRIDEWTADWKVRFITREDEDMVELMVTGFSKPVTMRWTEFSKPELFARRIDSETGGLVKLDRTFSYWDWKSIWNGRVNDLKRKKGITRGLREWLTNQAQAVEEQDDGFRDQVEDLILALAGRPEPIREAVEIWEQNGQPITDRLKVDDRSGGGLVQMRVPEDPLTGWYKIDGRIELWVKLDEITHKYRKAFGSSIDNRRIRDCLQRIGFIKEKVRKGPMEGRWFAKKEF